MKVNKCYKVVIANVITTYFLGVVCMAFHALYLWFRTFRKSRYPYNPINMYRQQLYDDWYNSLTPEQREKQDRFLEEQKRKRDKRLEKDINFLRLFVSRYGSPYLDVWNKIL